MLNYLMFLRHMIYWIADDYTLTQTTLVMLLMKLHIHCGSAIIVVSALNIYMYNVPNSSKKELIKVMAYLYVVLFLLNKFVF